MTGSYTKFRHVFALTLGLSFYAFFKNKNDNPIELMDAATWWIKTHELDHFEKAVKIREMVISGK